MRTQKFHKTECGVDFLINVLPFADVKESYLKKETYNTDYLEIVFFKKGSGHLVLNHDRYKFVFPSTVAGLGNI